MSSHPTSQTGDHTTSSNEDLPAGVPADAYDLDRLMQLTLAPLAKLGSSSDVELEDIMEWERTDIPRKSFEDLQWANLTTELANGAVSPEGYILARSLRPLQDEKAITRRLQEVHECQTLLVDDDSPPLRGVSDVRKAIAYAARGGVLDGESLYAIARNCDVSSRAARYYQQRKSQAPYLAEASYMLDACDELRHTLNHAVEPDGKLSDMASADLGRLRRAVQSHHERIRAKVEQLLRANSMEVHLQDDYFTMREERYVLPLRVSSKKTFGGIVHGYSSSGQTAYVEPDAIVELNNALRWAQIELQEEIDRILKRLSAMVARFEAALLKSLDALAYLDLIFAAGKLGNRLEATIPTISEGSLTLKRARHPLLWLKHSREVDGELFNDTIPNDLMLDEEKMVLVVSGPNTGGKTVLLKTLGLCAMMLRCGLTIPVDEGSSMPLFRAIYTDIGDEQSIERDLSTFSGHLVNINTFLDRTDHKSLVLLDELFAGTDPIQGAALAVALLDELTKHGAKTIVTTHLESLKTLAFQKETYANASMGFDLEKLAPTYHVIYGLPGSSYALRIASRLGFPEQVISRARGVLDGEEHQSVEEILNSLEDKRADMEKEMRRLEHARNEAENTKRRFKQKYDKLLQQEKELVHEQTRKLKKDLDKARSLIKKRIAYLQKAGAAENHAKEQKELEQMRDGLKNIEPTLNTAADFTKAPKTGPKGLVQISMRDIEEGMEIYAHAFKRKGVVVHYSEGEHHAQVQMGALKVKIPVDDLYYPSESARRAHQRGHKNTPKKKSNQIHVAQGVDSNGDVVRLLPQTKDNTVDLRGMRVDEALEKIDLFLDAVYGANLGGAYIIHGHGTGALKRAVRAALPSSSYVTEFRSGERTEGGDGVTVVFLRN